MRTCSKCQDSILEGQGFDLGGMWYCPLCFTKKAQERRALSSTDRDRLKRQVKEEMSGIIPREILREILEDGCHSLIQEAESEPILNRMVNEIERLCGLALARELLGIIQEMRKEIEVQEDEIRKKIKRLAEI